METKRNENAPRTHKRAGDDANAIAIVTIINITEELANRERQKKNTNMTKKIGEEERRERE